VWQLSRFVSIGQWVKGENDGVFALLVVLYYLGCTCESGGVPGFGYPKHLLFALSIGIGMC